MLKLFYSNICPFSRLARVLFAELSEKIELLPECLWNPSKEYLFINASGVLPSLYIYDNEVICNIIPIIEFIVDHWEESGARLIFGHRQYSDLLQKARIRYTLEWAVHKFYNDVTKYIINERIIKVINTNSEPNSQAIRIAKKNLVPHLEYFSYLLSQSVYLCGDELTVADFALASQISCLDLVNDIIWEKYDALKSWYSLLKSRGSLQTILQEQIPQLKPHKNYANPDF